METECNNQLPFLDVLIKKKNDGTLGHTVYRKPTHTDRYLHAESHHHPAQLQSVIKTLLTRSNRLADNEHQKEERARLQKAFNQNGFTNKDIRKATIARPRQEEEQEKPVSKANLPYIKGTTDKIRRILQKHNIRTTFTTDRKISTILQNPKTQIPLEDQGVYEIPCKDCDHSYIGQTNRRVEVRREEHRNAVKKEEKTSSLAQHAKTTSHEIDFDNTKILARIDNTKSRIIREAIEIEKRPHNLNTRDDTQRLPTAWKPALRDKQITRGIKEARKPSTADPPKQQEKAGPVTRSQTRNQPSATGRNDQTLYNHQPDTSNGSVRLTRSATRRLPT